MTMGVRAMRPQVTQDIASAESKSDFAEHKVVICYQDGRRVKGLLRIEAHSSLESLLDKTDRNLEGGMTFFCPEGGEPETLDLREAKAVYFVKTFEGDNKRDKIRFYENGPEVGLLWVEVQFLDDEVEEGAVHNSIHHLVQDGFFLHTSDPESNNKLVYVKKSAIKRYRVLGLRPIDSGLWIPVPQEIDTD